MNTISNIDRIDAANLAHIRLDGKAAVLSRLAQLMHRSSDEAEDTPAREQAFWYGVRIITDEIIEEAHALHEAASVREGVR